MEHPPTKPGMEAQHNYAQPAPPPMQPAAAVYTVAPPQFAQPQPLPGKPVKGPSVTPAPGSVIIAYREVPPEGGCSCDLKPEGWLVVVILILLVPCVACIPCCLTSCQNSYQEPVYGHPSQTHQQVPVAQPV